jgi:hypothetical protein
MSFFVGLLGFEPRQTESKSVVLPLHHNPILNPKFWFGSAKIGVDSFSPKWNLKNYFITSVITCPTQPLGICICSIAASVAEISVM